jgi:hypothetical protein
MFDGVTPDRPKQQASADITPEAPSPWAFDGVTAGLPAALPAVASEAEAERRALTLKNGVLLPYRLFTPGQVALATFLGGPLAGYLLLSANDARLEQCYNGWGTFWRGVGFSLVVLVAYVVLELISPVLPLLIGVITPLILYCFASDMHGAACRAQRAAGGRSGTIGGLIGRTFLGAFLLVALSLLAVCGLDGTLSLLSPARFR